MLAQIAKNMGAPLMNLIGGARPIFLSALKGSTLSLLLSSVYPEHPLLICADDAEMAGYLYADLVQILSEDSVLFFPSAYKRSVKYGHRDDANSLMRSMVMTALLSAQVNRITPPIIVTYPEALAESVQAPQMTEGEQLTLHRGQTISQKTVMDKLYSWGYERTDYVYEVGQYAQRGSILDIYSYSSELPYRLDFWDDELDSIRTFEVESQLSINKHEQITLAPDLGSSRGQGISLLQLLPKVTSIVMSDEHYLCDRIGYIWEDAPQVHDGEGFDDLSSMQAVLVTKADTEEALKSLRHIYYHTAPSRGYSEVAMLSEEQALFGKNYDALTEYLETLREEGYQAYLCSSDAKQSERIYEILSERGFSDPSAWLQTIPCTLHEGFVLPDDRVAVLTEHQVFGRYHKYNLRSDKAKSGKITLSLKELSTFNPGDLVVHSEHGIGRFGGLITMDLGGRSQECVKIEYNRGDTIYVNLHSLHKLSHYRQRDEAESVTLSTIGTGAWQRIKEKTKKQVKDIARDLIKLYAKRKESEGFAYSADTYLQHELEASFAYVETPDQAKAIEAIKTDMERPYPMDRLLCGDVGFGKTEVAIRAAFKAATDGKQVAVLVPTTVLAYQHYRTFKQRLEGFPVRVEYISRAKTAKELRATLSELKEGKIDIVIGTHRLTSKDVVFHDLGLLIIDEEQKFGVAAKEKLRRLQVNVDTLAMSATPIPRTLQFSLMGAREISNLNTPPSNRVPVETILTRFSAEGIREAINFELSRNGQVYMVHNRIQNIEEVAAVIRREVPDARVVVGHGQMSPTELERILMAFGQHDYDVLVATTIIENGIDVPNANTIIINDAHRYGLSELHQLRGRVGRSNRKAFCYMLTPPLATLSDESRRRVRAIENFSDLGSGVRIALQDLDIRGAGNALGAEQSGFIADMGYETYQKVFTEAVKELKTTEFASLYQDETSPLKADLFIVETQVETDLKLSLPQEYVPNDAERIILYRELDDLSSDSELEAYRARLVDRFGALPQEAEDLIEIPRLRRLAQDLGFEKVVLRTGLMNLFLPADSASPYYKSETFGIVLSYVAEHTKLCEFRERQGKHIIRVKDIEDLQAALTVIREMHQRLE